MRPYVYCLSFEGVDIASEASPVHQKCTDFRTISFRESLGSLGVFHSDLFSVVPDGLRHLCA